MEIDQEATSLLSAPNGAVPSTSQQRVSAVTSAPLDDNFTLKQQNGVDMAKQYANMYYLRLVRLKKRVLARALQKWSQPIELDGNLEDTHRVDRVLGVEAGQLCFIIGTIYLEMALKPDVLAEISRRNNVELQPLQSRAHKMTSDTDQMYIEDESGRLRLIGDKLKDVNRDWKCVTGVIAAVQGRALGNDQFQVLDVCFAGLPEQPERPLKSKSSEEGQWIALVSGLELGGREDADDVRVDLLAEWLTGELGSQEDQDASCKIAALVLAGNSMRQPSTMVDVSNIGTKDSKKPKKYGYDSSGYSSHPTQALNYFLSTLLPSIEVFILPGEKDPALPTMPQQPLHAALLPNAAKYDSEGFWRTTNPTWIDYAGTKFMGTSGQTIDDIYQYLEDNDRLGMARHTLEWNHLAPTAPDTLYCYPFIKTDPFILSETPHVYFVGNQPNFATELVKGPEGQEVRIILIPSFLESATAVLVNTASLEVKTVQMAV